jgi:hypothetical protein
MIRVQVAIPGRGLVEANWREATEAARLRAQSEGRDVFVVKFGGRSRTRQDGPFLRTIRFWLFYADAQLAETIRQYAAPDAPVPDVTCCLLRVARPDGRVEDLADPGDLAGRLALTGLAGA